MTPGSFVFASAIQLGTFLAPLGLAWAGMISGEMAGLVAILGWFAVGMPLSYAATDTLRRRKALRTADEGRRHHTAPACDVIVSSP